MVRGEGTEERALGDLRGVSRRKLEGGKVLIRGRVLSQLELSFFGVRDNFIATLDGVFTGVLKLRLCLEGVKKGDWVGLVGVEPPFNGVFRIDLAANPNLGVGGWGAMLNWTLLLGEKKSSTSWKFFIGVF